MADDITRWMRLVRPPTHADAGWAESAEADQLLAEVHHRLDDNMATDRVGVRKIRVLRTWAPAVVLAGAAALAVGLAAPATAPAPGVPDGATGAPRVTSRPTDMLLTGFDSCGSLLTGLRAATAAHVDQLVPAVELRHATFYAGTNAGSGQQSKSAAVAGLPQAYSGGGTSTTNDQEAGANEPDTAKTDDGRLITVTDGVLHVVDAKSRSLTGALDLTMYQGWADAQLVVSGQHALVLLGGSPTYAYGSVSVPVGAMRPYVGAFTGTPQKSTYLFVDLTGAPRVTGSFRASGSYLDARMVGSTVRLVVRSTPELTLPNPAKGTRAQRLAAQRRAVQRAPLSAWLPSYTMTSGYQLTAQSVGCSAVSHPANYTGTSMLTIYTLDLDHLDRGPAPVSVAADGDTVYGTGSSLYIASNPGWSVDSGGTGQTTQIHRFDITGTGAPTYLGSGQVPGRLLSRYSLSDYQGSLRVATTDGRVTSNAVYVLRADTLRQTGHVDGLGRGERIYAVRFEGAVGYVVTFRETDPLYVLDLRDPNAPVVAGSLHLTGYSDYLHDAGDGRLIGVGQQANGQGRVAGLQVALFDVSHPATPRRTGHVVVPRSADESPLDPHAFLYWVPTGLTVVPIPNGGGNVLVLRVDGHALHRVGTVSNGAASPAQESAIVRSVLVNGALWTVSADGIRVSDPQTLAKQAWIAF